MSWQTVDVLERNAATRRYDRFALTAACCIDIDFWLQTLLKSSKTSLLISWRECIHWSASLLHTLTAVGCMPFLVWLAIYHTLPQPTECSCADIASFNAGSHRPSMWSNNLEFKCGKDGMKVRLRPYRHEISKQIVNQCIPHHYGLFLRGLVYLAAIERERLVLKKGKMQEI